MEDLDHGRRRLYDLIGREVVVKLTAIIPGALVESIDDVPTGVLRITGELQLTSEPAALIGIKQSRLREHGAMEFTVGDTRLALAFIPCSIDGEQALRFELANGVAVTVRPLGGDG
jgi:hypothetical protein